MVDCVGDQVDVYAGVYDTVGVGLHRGRGRPAAASVFLTVHRNRNYQPQSLTEIILNTVYGQE